MKCWYGLLAVLLALPTFGDDSSGWPPRFRGGALLISVHNVEKLAGKFADWTTSYGAPEGNYQFQRLQLCQNRPWGVPNTEPQFCYPLIWAQSLDSKVGYVQADVSYAGVKVQDANAWYRVSRKWNSRLEWRKRPRSPLPDDSPSQPNPHGWYYQEQYPVIPGNRWDDPRYEERKDK